MEIRPNLVKDATNLRVKILLESIDLLLNI